MCPERVFERTKKLIRISLIVNNVHNRDLTLSPGFISKIGDYRIGDPDLLTAGVEMPSIEYSSFRRGISRV